MNYLDFQGFQGRSQDFSGPIVVKVEPVAPGLLWDGHPVGRLLHHVDMGGVHINLWRTLLIN